MHDTIPSDLQGTLLSPSPVLAPGLAYEICSPCRDGNRLVIQDAVSTLTELAPAPLLEEIDGVSGGDSRIIKGDTIEGLDLSSNVPEEAKTSAVTVVTVDQVLAPTLNSGPTNSFYEWVQRTKEEIEKIESGSSSDEDSKVNVPEDIHIERAEGAPQFGPTRIRYASTYAENSGSLRNLACSDSESDDDEPCHH